MVHPNKFTKNPYTHLTGKNDVYEGIYRSFFMQTFLPTQSFVPSIIDVSLYTSNPHPYVMYTPSIYAAANIFGHALL